MRESEPRQVSSQLPVHTINGRSRLILVITGIVSWLAGGAASFVSRNGAGALIVAGMLREVLALMGRWPSRISMSGNEISWDAVQQTVNSQIQVAEGIGESDDVLA